GAGVAPGAVPHDGAGGAPEAVPLVPALLAELRRHVTCGFQDTRVLEAQANFFQDLMMPVERYLLTHGCVVLGPSGVGKTTLVNRLCGAHFHTGPRMEDQTTRAHSCDLTLEDLSPDWPDLCSVLIDTPGWSSETAGEIKSEYKRILQERQLVSEYTPHILLFCVSLPQLRAFRRQAEQMSQELQELKIDRRYPIKVLPVATLADTQRMEDLEELLKEVKDLAEIVFHKSSAEVEEPAWTMFNPNGDCGPLMSFGCALFRDPKQSRRFFPKLPGGWNAWEFGLPILITRAARCHHCSTVSVDHSVLLRDLKSLIATSVAEGGQSTKNYSKWRGERTDKQPFSVMGTREVGGYDAPSVKGNANVQRTE
ncbi:unnamed protein product, partial [Durusdinium trenchii]